MFTPRKCGVKFDPPTLVVFYEVNLTAQVGYGELVRIKFNQKHHNFEMKTTQTINANKNAAERFKVIANAKEKVECKFLISVSDAVDELKNSSRHGKYLENISYSQLEKLLTMIQNKMKGMESNQIKNISSGPRPNGSEEEDLNKLDDYELDKRKAAMDEDFEKNRLRPGDVDYVYDKEVEFNEGKIESGWDDEDDYSDPDF